MVSCLLAGASNYKICLARILDFNWSADHKSLLLTRGDVTSDVVVLSNLR
jgi:hypothetical protein